MTIAGPSGSGKTEIAGEIISNLETMVTPKIQKVVYCYQVWQPKFDYFKDNNLVDDFVEGILDEETFKRKTASSQPTLFVIDDSMNEKNVSNMDKIFSVSRHSNASLIFITQNFFHPNIRNITLNCDYLIIMKNKRDRSIITQLSKQLYPGEAGFMRSAYNNATDQPYSYLFIGKKKHSITDQILLFLTFLDMKQETPQFLSIRARILPSEIQRHGPMIVYIKKETLPYQSQK